MNWNDSDLTEGLNLSGNDLSWERYRAYLRFLVESQIEPQLNGHLDLSGIVQQTLLEAHEAAKAGDANVTLPWLRRVLSNNLTDEVRKLHADKRDVRRERRLAQAIEQSSIRLEAMLVDSSPSPSENVARKEQVLNLSLALEKLPESQRKAIFLKMWQDRSLLEIATQMGKTPQAVAGLLKRGLRQLRVELHATGKPQDESTGKDAE